MIAVWIAGLALVVAVAVVLWHGTRPVPYPDCKGRAQEHPQMGDAPCASCKGRGSI